MFVSFVLQLGNMHVRQGTSAWLDSMYVMGLKIVGMVLMNRSAFVIKNAGSVIFIDVILLISAFAISLQEISVENS